MNELTLKSIAILYSIESCNSSIGNMMNIQFYSFVSTWKIKSRMCAWLWLCPCVCSNALFVHFGSKLNRFSAFQIKLSHCLATRQTENKITALCLFIENKERNIKMKYSIFIWRWTGDSRPIFQSIKR